MLPMLSKIRCFIEKLSLEYRLKVYISIRYLSVTENSFSFITTIMIGK
jgi:hypothetical protein